MGLYGDDLPISNYEFFDDVLLMEIPTIREYSDINHILANFIDALGTYIKMGKYKTYLFNTKLTMHGNLSKFIGFYCSSLPTKSLGEPLVNNSL